MKKLIDYFINDNNRIICYYNDKSTKVLDENYENTGKLLDRMTDEHLKVRDSLIDKVKKLDKISSILIRTSYILFFLTFIQSILMVTLPINLSLISIALSKTSILELVISIITLGTGYHISRKSDKIFDELDKKDFVIDNIDVLNSTKSIEIIREINPKLFEIMRTNRFRLLPSLNINTAKYLNNTDINILEEELGINTDFINEDEVEEPVKYNTKIIKFRKKLNR